MFNTLNGNFYLLTPSFLYELLLDQNDDLCLSLDDIRIFLNKRSFNFIEKSVEIKQIVEKIETFFGLHKAYYKKISHVLLHVKVNPTFQVSELVSIFDVIHSNIDEGTELIYGTTKDDALLPNAIQICFAII